jgi:LysM repeat protein
MRPRFPLPVRAAWLPLLFLPLALHAQAPGTHTVAPGETLYGIARAYNVPLTELLAANPGREGYAIAIGEVLRLPAAAGEGETPPDDPRPDDPAPVPAGERNPPPSEPAATAPDVPVPAGAGDARPPANARPTAEARPPAGVTRPHVLAPGETLFSLTAAYDVALSELLAANPGLDPRALQPGMTLRVPVPAEEPAAAAAEVPAAPAAIPSRPVAGEERPANPAIPAAAATPAVAPGGAEPERVPPSAATAPADSAAATALPGPAPDSAAAPRWHVVQAGETFYGIARAHGLDVDALRRANGGRGTALSPGERLRLPPSAEGRPERVRTAQPVLPADWLRERGVATYLDASSPANGEHLALHDRAPVGATIVVRNLMNNRRVEARVVGRLPANRDDGRTVCTLSPGAARALGAHDPRVLVEVAWAPPSAEGQDPGPGAAPRP